MKAKQLPPARYSSKATSAQVSCVAETSETLQLVSRIQKSTSQKVAPSSRLLNSNITAMIERIRTP